MFETALVCVEAKIEREEEEGRIKVRERESESNAHTRALTQWAQSHTRTRRHTRREYPVNTKRQSESVKEFTGHAEERKREVERRDTSKVHRLEGT